MECECSVFALKCYFHLPHQPVALLAGFYRGQHFRQAHFKQWIGLDEARVVPELLSQVGFRLLLERRDHLS